MSNSTPNVAYFIHLALEITEDGVQRPMDHLVFFNGLTKYILPKSKFQELNICNLADLEGGTPFVIDDKSIVAESDVFKDHTYIDNLLKFFKEDEIHSPKLFFQIATCDGPKKSKDYMLTLLDPKLDVKHPFSITMPFYALPQILKVVKYARISFGSKIAGYRRKTYPAIAQFTTADNLGTPTYVSDRAITHDVLANLLLVFDARLIIGAPHHPGRNDFLHLSDQIIAHKRFGVDLSATALGSALLDVYNGNERLLSKVNKYFSPIVRSGTYAERLVEGLDATRTKVILIPDLNPAFRMREAEAIAKNLFDSGLFYPWIITPASQRTTESNFSELNSCKANPATTSEIKLLKPPINLGQLCANASYNHTKTSNMVHLMAYDYNPTDANSSLSTHLPFSIAEFPLSNPVLPDASGYDTDPGTRFIVDFAVARARLRTSKILDKLAKTCKFWPSPELTFRLNRHLRYTVDFSTERAMQAFLNFCDNTSGHFAFPRNEALVYAFSSVPYFIRAAKGEKDPDSFMLVLQALFNLKNSEMFPVGNMTAAIRLPGNINVPEALRSVNKELQQDYFLSAFTPGKDLIDLTRQRPNRPTHYSRRPRDQSSEWPNSHSAWYALNGGEDYSNLAAIESVCRHIKASNVHRAWSLTSGTSIIFNLSAPISAFEYGGRNFTVSPFALGSELTISQVTFEPDFDKIFEIDSNEGEGIEDDLCHQLAAIRHLRVSLGLDSLEQPDDKDDDMDVAAEEKLPAGNADAAIGAKPGPPAEPSCPDCKPSFPCVLHFGPPLVPTAATLTAAQSSLDPEADSLMNSEEPVLERDPKKARNTAVSGPAAATNSSDKNNPVRKR